MVVWHHCRSWFFLWDSSLIIPELLAPAGTLAHLDYAYAYGADAVYAGMPRYGLRVRENDFDLQHLQTGIDRAHTQQKKIYITANILPHNSKVKTFVKDLAPMIAMGPDALIMASVLRDVPQLGLW